MNPFNKFLLQVATGLVTYYAVSFIFQVNVEGLKVVL